LNHRESRLRCLAERSLMRALEGGCSVPIGVETTMETGGNKLKLKAVVVTVDGEEAVNGEGEITFEDDDEDGAADQLGTQVAHLLIDRGAQKLLDKMRAQKERVEKVADVGDDASEKTVVEMPPLSILKEPDVNGS
jgi:hydroxymethylbilane synthase